MKTLAGTPISVLDLATYPQGKTIHDAYVATKTLAQKAEAWGYSRYWLAEHHNLEGIASAATSVLIGFVAGHTSKIRVGSGGIMLPNHSPMVIAEQFGTLETLYPGRIDLGLGRAPGSDQATMRALRGAGARVESDFGEQIEELEAYFAPAEPGQRLKAIPGAGIDVPIWILGSSLYSAHLAARLGRPYAFAGHFAPGYMMQALQIYRSEFQPSRGLEKPRVMVGAPMIAAPSDEEAEFLATSLYLRFLNLVRRGSAQAQPPVPTMEGLWTPQEEMAVRSSMALLVVGGPLKIKQGFENLLHETQADELIITSETYSLENKLRSYQILAEVAGLKPVS
ncbi:MAG: LLM class flavin-dependent oxidoreductase [Bdellovibrionaceae bacterium]|nr:LLM class flavin-dependent oxidoreductase [Pseudobdellovibrionaceae bacterium]